MNSLAEKYRGYEIHPTCERHVRIEKDGEYVIRAKDNDAAKHVIDFLSDYDFDKPVTGKKKKKNKHKRAA